MEVSLAAEKLFSIGPISVTNSMFLSWIMGVVMLIFAYFATRNMKRIPSGIQNFAETILEALYNLFESMAGERAKLFFPVLTTFFLFIVINNWAGLLPGVGSIGFYEKPHAEAAATHETPTASMTPASSETATTTVDDHGAPVDDHGATQPVASAHQEAAEAPHGVEPAKEEAEEHGGGGHEGFVPYLRAATSDLNTTLALAFISVVATQYFGIRKLGLLGYVKHYFHSPLTGTIAVVALGMIIGIFIGMLEVISEFVKIVSLSLRLFGNIYAGEAVLHTVSGLLAFFAPIPFLLLEVIVGVVQASVFMMLTLVFLVIITSGHDDHAQEHAEAHH